LQKSRLFWRVAGVGIAAGPVLECLQLYFNDWLADLSCWLLASWIRLLSCWLLAAGCELVG